MSLCCISSLSQSASANVGNYVQIAHNISLSVFLVSEMKKKKKYTGGINDPLRAFFTFVKKSLNALIIMTFKAINKVMCACNPYETINIL